MLNVTEATKNAYKNYGSSKELTITITKNGLTKVLTNTDIVSQSLSLQEILESTENLTFTGCNASSFKFSCADIVENIKEASISVSIVADNTESVPLFTGYIDSVTNHSHEQRTMEIMAYDKLFKINNLDYRGWYDALTFPMTLKSFRDEFFFYIGITQETVTLPNDNMVIRKTIDDEVITGKTILTCICQINGRYGRIGRNGNFQYVKLEPPEWLLPSETLYPSTSLYPGVINSNDGLDKALYSNINFENYYVESIDRVQFVNKNGEITDWYGASTSLNTFTVENNPLIWEHTSEELQTIGHNLLDEIADLVFTPLIQLELTGLPYLECGDLISVSTKRSTVDAYILQRTLSGAQALKDAYEAVVEQYQPTFVPNIETKLQQTIEKSKEETEKLITDYDLAVQMMNNLAVNAMGAYQNYEDIAQGGRVYYLSNMPIIKRDDGTCVFDANSTVFKLSGAGLFVSSDGGITWTNGYNPQTGQLVVNVLNAIGINADWIVTGSLMADFIKGGTLELGGYNNTMGILKLYDNRTSTNSWDGSGHEGDSWWMNYTFNGKSDYVLDKFEISAIADPTKFNNVVWEWKISDDGGNTWTNVDEGEITGEGEYFLNIAFSVTDTQKYRLSIGKYLVEAGDSSFSRTIYYSSLATKLTKDGIDTNNIRIIGGQFNINNNFIVDSSGNMKAKAGYIGNGQYGFKIENTYIANKLTAVSDTSQDGAYYGINGMAVNANGKHSHVMGSEIVTQGTLSAKGFTIGSPSATNTVNGRLTNTNGMTMQTVPDDHTIALLQLTLSKYVAWAGGSDIRLKENIQDLDIDFVRDIFKNVRPVSFNYKSDEDKITEFGLIAQELNPLLHELGHDDTALTGILEGEEQYQIIHYEKMAGLFISAIQDLYKRVEDLEAQIKELKNE